MDDGWYIGVENGAVVWRTDGLTDGMIVGAGVDWLIGCPVGCPVGISKSNNTKFCLAIWRAFELGT